MAPDRIRTQIALRGAVALAGLLFAAYTLLAPAVRAQKNPHPPVRGNAAVKSNDAVARLQQRLDRGEAKLEFSKPGGWLQSVLKQLDIPVSSQSLVFSRTSLQSGNINIANPRAIYFNDDVYVGWIRGADILEIAAVDPQVGGVYYTLEQDNPAPQPFVRQDTCMRCHVSPNTRFIPGYFVRSILPEGFLEGVTNITTMITDHTSPFSERWGGWYVTGTHHENGHLGNMPLPGDGNHGNPEQLSGGSLTSLARKVDLTGYAAPHSDIVAMMVLAHQTQMQNLMVYVEYETNMALAADEETARAGKIAKGQISAAARWRIGLAVDELLRYMLFADEAPLHGEVKGTSGYAEQFMARGPRDQGGRSLRDFDLQRRMFRYPLSYQIYTAAFDALPAPALDILYRKLWEGLGGETRDKAFAALSAADRRAILEILTDTKKNLPDYFYGNRGRAE
ncbi:MAG: hypothetical protein ACKV2V_03545 [Blastocatellia bacterium]